MKILKRLALGAIGAASGVLIACAYGMSYSWYGQVRDSDTGQTIEGIQVDCVNGGQTIASTTTGSQGMYNISESHDCESLEFVDVDGATNGTYDATQIDNPSISDENNISLNPTN